MYYYKTTVRLGGNTMNEVQKLVSAPEFLVLQFVHGTDALVNVQEIKNERVNYTNEKRRLKDLYEMSLIKRDQSVDGIFGALGTLPDRLPPELIERYNIDEDGFRIVDVTESELKQAAKPGYIKNKPVSAKSDIEIERETRVVPSEEVNVADLME